MDDRDHRPLRPADRRSALSIDPNEIQVMRKSEYSGKFGDYSTFSDEMDHLSDIPEEEEE